MREKHYYLCKKGNDINIVYLDYNRLKGCGFSPKNNVKYDGIVVNKMVIIKPSMIEKVLKKKIKRKLDIYLKLIMNFIEDNDSSDSGVLSEALNDLTRFKGIVNKKYQKYLDDKYLQILQKKIALLEYELKNKYLELDNEYEEEKTSHMRR